jgi:hypothetical protein
MDTQKSASSLPSIRTLARDLAKSQNTPSASTATERGAASPKVSKPISEPVIAGAGESRIYQAPTAKNIPVPPPAALPPTPKLVEKKEMAKPKAPEPGLRPISGPKSVGSTTIVVDNEDAASATIIRDTKSNRFRLFPAIGTSLSTWFSDIKEKYFTKKAPKYTVPDTTTRQGVIQKATSQTGKIATFDHTSLHARIREREDRTLPKTPTTTWTANTEPGFPLLEAPEGVAISNVQVVPRKSFRTETPPPAPAVTIPVAPKPVEEPAPATNRATTIVERPTPIVVSETEPVVPTATIESTDTRPEPEPEPEPNSLPETPVETDVDSPHTAKEWLFAINTNLISLSVATLVLCIGAVSAVGYFWYKSTQNAIEIVTLPNHPTYLEAPLQILSVEILGRDTIWREVVENQNQSGPDVLLLALATSPSGEVLLPVPTVVAGLDFKTTASFTRSLDALYFGSLRKTTPFILLRATDAATALGGMLDWEQTLYTDIEPMLALQAGATDPTATFTDLVVAGADARALVDTSGTVRLIYNLPKKNIIVITTSKEALQEILATVK